MRSFQIVVVVSLVAMSATTAGAQFGLYGSPEILSFSQVEPAGVPYGGYATPASYPGRLAAPTTRYVPRVPYVAVPLPQYAALPYQYLPAGPYAGAPVAPLPSSPSPSDVPVQGSGAVDQMLNESGGYLYTGNYGEAAPGGCAQCDVPDCRNGCFAGPVQGFEQAACGGGCGAPRSCSPWYASLSALVMGRNDANPLWTTFEAGNDSNQIGSTQFAMRWRWGAEVRIGRRFCCDTWGLEATFWALDSFEGSRVFTNPNGVSTPLTVGNVFFDGNAATQWFDDALVHRIRRRNEFYNLELNLIRNRLLSTSELPWDIGWSAGVRFFRFEENLIFSSLADPANMTDPSMSREAFLNDRIVNELVGFQFGFDANYYLASNCRLFLIPKFGVYNNHIQNLFQVYLGDGTVATQFEYPGRTYPVSSSKNVFSFMTQLDMGLEWQFRDNWSARVGYRAVVATGIGLADNQIPHFIVDIPEISNIDHNGELILHGAFVGVAYNF